MTAASHATRYETRYIRFPDWLTSADAAEVLGVSTTRVHALRKDKRFKQVAVIDPDSKRPVYLYDRKEVEKLAAATKPIGGRLPQQK